MMKEIYETPKMEVVVFETEDIITTSGDPNNYLGGDNNTDGMGIGQ